MIILHSEVEVEMMRAAGKNAARLLNYLGNLVAPGVSTEQINQAANEWAEENQVTHAPLGYQPNGLTPFPKSICTSLNEVICHGIPSSHDILKKGDLINIDVSPITNGWHGDTSRTFIVGQVNEHAEKLVRVTRECLEKGIGQVKPGAYLGDIGHAILKHARENGFSVVKEFVGHGIGRKFHMAPVVPHFGEPGKGVRLRPGMIFTIEPMINQGAPDIKMLDDWIAVTQDGSLSAQFEETVLVTTDAGEVLTNETF